MRVEASICGMGTMVTDGSFVTFRSTYTKLAVVEIAVVVIRSLMALQPIQLMTMLSLAMMGIVMMRMRRPSRLMSCWMTWSWMMLMPPQITVVK